MTWNVENPFDPGSGAGASTEPVYQAKLQWLAATNAQAPAYRRRPRSSTRNALDYPEVLLDSSWPRHVSTHPEHRHMAAAGKERQGREGTWVSSRAR